jgi:wyosine [tRNA(Phe)-imidazoG37] synthetase (radical SAM superfamily)
MKDYLDNRFVYVALSRRAHGLAIGVNLNPDRRCNFNCLYCEVNRALPLVEGKLDIKVMAEELDRTLTMARRGQLRQRPAYQAFPEELLRLRDVALTGDGEPTLADDFAEAVKAVIHVRASSGIPFFKIVLLTNASSLRSAPVRAGLKYLTNSDEVWTKLDAGTEAWFGKINRTTISYDTILSNILGLAKERPVVIQSLFPSIHGEEPKVEEIEAYAHRLKELRDAGAQISCVQIYSASRPSMRSECRHIPLRSLSLIAQRVRQVSGLKTEIF